MIAYNAYILQRNYTRVTNKLIHAHECFRLEPRTNHMIVVDIVFKQEMFRHTAMECEMQTVMPNNGIRPGEFHLHACFV